MDNPIHNSRESFLRAIGEAKDHLKKISRPVEKKNKQKQIKEATTKALRSPYG